MNSPLPRYRVIREPWIVWPGIPSILRCWFRCPTTVRYEYGDPKTRCLNQQVRCCSNRVFLVFSRTLHVLSNRFFNNIVLSLYSIIFLFLCYVNISIYIFFGMLFLIWLLRGGVFLLLTNFNSFHFIEVWNLSRSDVKQRICT